MSSIFWSEGHQVSFGPVAEKRSLDADFLMSWVGSSDHFLFLGGKRCFSIKRWPEYCWCVLTVCKLYFLHINTWYPRNMPPFAFWKSLDLREWSLRPVKRFFPKNLEEMVVLFGIFPCISMLFTRTFGMFTGPATGRTNLHPLRYQAGETYSTESPIISVSIVIYSIHMFNGNLRGALNIGER